MNNEYELDNIRRETLKSMDRNETLFKLSLGLCGLAEVIGLVAVFWFIDWSDATHKLIFAATMLVWVNLALWILALAIKNRVGEQRILKAIHALVETLSENEND